MLIPPRCAASLCRVDVIFKIKPLGFPSVPFFRVLARLSKASPPDVVTFPRPWNRLVGNAPAFDWQLYESYDWVAIHTSEDAYETTVQTPKDFRLGTVTDAETPDTPEEACTK